MWDGRLFHDGYLVVVACGVAWLLLAALWRQYRRRRCDRRDDEAACGCCAYLIAPGASTTCPECGHDVRRVGLVTGDTMPPLPAIPVYALAVLLVLPLGVWFGRIAADVQPFGWRWDADYWVHFDNPPGNRYPGRQHIVIKACGSGRYRRARPDVVDARAIGFQTVSMTSHWGGSEAAWCELFASDAGQAWVGSFDDQIVRRFVNEAGCDPETAQGRRAVAEVEQRVRFLAAAAFPTTLDEAKVKAALPGFDIYYRLDGRVKRACVQLAWLVLVPLVVRTVWNYRGRRYELVAVRSREAADRLGLTPPSTQPPAGGTNGDTRDVSHCCIFYRYT